MLKLLPHTSESAGEVVDPHQADELAVQHTSPAPSTEVDTEAREDGPALAWLTSLLSGLWQFLRPHRTAVTGIFVAVCVELGLESGQRAGVRYLIDEAILRGQWGWLAPLLGLLLAASLAAAVAAIGREYLYAKLCAAIPGEIRARLFERLQLFPLPRLRAPVHGDLVSRLTNDAGSVEPMLWSLGYMVVDVAGILWSLALLALTEWRLTLVGVVLWPLALWGAHLFSPRAARASYATRTGLGRLAAFGHENLATQLVQRVFGLDDLARRRFEEHNQWIIATSRRYNLLAYLALRVPHIVIQLIQLLLLGLGGWMTLTGQLTTGQLVSFYLLFSGLCQYTWDFMAYVPHLLDASAGMRRIREVLDHPVPTPCTAQTKEFKGFGDGLRFEEVSFSHNGGQSHLDRASFHVPKGETVAFIGASGSGKSTALQLLLGLQHPDAGRISIDGVDLREFPLDSYLSRVGAVFQDSLLFHASIRDNIRAGRLTASDEEIRRATRSAGLDGWIRSLPAGYETLVSGDACSGGQRQRLAIARALVRDPALLVLDEPTSALDAATSMAVMQTLRKTSAGRTVVLVTHQLREAAAASRIVLFDQGRVVEIGTHAELLARRGLYANLWNKQRNVHLLVTAGAEEPGWGD